MERLLFATFMAPNLTPVYARVVDEVGRALGRPAELIEGTAATQLVDGPVDVAFICGLPYIRLEAGHPGALTILAAPILEEPRYEGRPVYFSDVIVRRDSPYRSFKELKGTRWAHNEDGSFSGCLVTRHHLHALGESEAFFGRVTYSGGHLISIQEVLRDDVDASAIDSHVLGVERRANPQLDQRLRVVASFGPSPIPPVVATNRVPDDLAGRIREALCVLADDSRGRDILAGGMIRRFVPVDDRDYDGIRRALADVEGANRNPTATPTTAVS